MNSKTKRVYENNGGFKISQDVLEFGQVSRKPDIRYAKDMSEVILDKNWLKNNENRELYYMYRDLWRRNDKERIRSRNLRYDITVIPPLKMGKEFVKTKGHYHPDYIDGLSYPEIYEILEGEAHYLLQRKTSSDELEDIVLMEAGPGDKALIPPNYGHITINPSNRILKMSNWVNRKFDSIYGDIVEKNGGAYFELTNGEFVQNENYENPPEIRKISPKEIPEFGIQKDKNMYNLIENPKNLEFLNKPDKFQELFNEYI